MKINTNKGEFEQSDLDAREVWRDDGAHFGPVLEFRRPGDDEVIAVYTTPATIAKASNPFAASTPDEILLELPSGERVTRPTAALAKRTWSEGSANGFAFCVEYLDAADGARHESRHVFSRPGMGGTVAPATRAE